MRSSLARAPSLLTMITYIFGIYSFVRHQLNIILYHLEFLEIFLESTLVHHFLAPSRQAILDHEWKAYSTYVCNHLRSYLSLFSPRQCPLFVLFPPMHLKIRILLTFSPTLVTTDPARLVELRNMHVQYIRERDHTPMASFIRLVLAAQDVRRKGD
ncbi:hypothetical protein EDD85DRAFT_581446 [Armillaria nabsnona]|nr:hypothetical protein EDD85DRAFT_581446 [Armillaria nabsnona]